MKFTVMTTGTNTKVSSIKGSSKDKVGANTLQMISIWRSSEKESFLKKESIAGKEITHTKESLVTRRQRARDVS